MTINPEQKKHACVIGDPIAHSLSPLLHQAWIKALGLNASYEGHRVKPELFCQGVDALFARPGFVGMNITLPHKSAALKLANKASESAKKAGAANLLIRKNGTLYADNMDIEGFCSPLLRMRGQAEWKNKKTVIIGAGGAARAALVGALKLDPGAITLLSRTDERTRALADEFDHRVTAALWARREDELLGAALLVNASAGGMKGKEGLDLSLHRLGRGALVYDLVYTPLKTRLLLQAQDRGFSILGGLDMLIAQARPSFEMFYGTPPPEDNDVKKVLMKALGEHG